MLTRKRPFEVAKPNKPCPDVMLWYTILLYLVLDKRQPMRIRALINKLLREGFIATKGRIRCALLGGYISPIPTKDAQGAFLFTAKHLKQIRWYFVHIHPGPCSYYPTEYPCTGDHDRLRRLAKKKASRNALLERRKAFDEAILWLEGIAEYGV